MARKRKSPPPGTVFLIPLQDHGYATGVMARVGGGGLCLGYFFGPRVADVKDCNLAALTANQAILVGHFGDLHLIEGAWPIIGNIQPWVPNDWPVPQMARLDVLNDQRATPSTYDERLRCVAEEEITPQQAKQYPYDSLMGSGAVEIVLTHLLTTTPGDQL